MYMRYKIGHFVNGGIGYDLIICLSTTGEIFLNLYGSDGNCYTYHIIEVPQSLVDTIKKEVGVYSDNGTD